MLSTPHPTPLVVLRTVKSLVKAPPFVQESHTVSNLPELQYKDVLFKVSTQTTPGVSFYLETSEIDNVLKMID
eukprot:6479205-Amphidinium_carterae.2